MSVRGGLIDCGFFAEFTFIPRAISELALWECATSI